MIKGDIITFKCICIKDDWDIDGRVYKDKIYTCEGHPDSIYYSVTSGNKYYGIFEKENFKPLADWREQQINSILEDD